jgi:hypothetical protein
VRKRVETGVSVIGAIAVAYLLAGCGKRWDAMSGPNIEGTNAMAAVEAFVATNGWNMQSNGPPFEVTGRPWKLISGLPWKSLRNREFRAVTQKGILYVLSNPGWHHDSAGVAYNPQTNRFGPTIRGFKPIGGHWYVWFQPEFQSHTFTQQYE